MTSLREAPARATALAVASVLLFALQQHLVDLAGLLQRGADEHSNGGRILGPEFYQNLPYPVIDEIFLPPTSIHLALIALGVVETLVLFGLYRALRGRTVGVAERVGLAVATVAMLLVALNARTVIGFDLYAYLGYAKLASVHAAYAPPPGRFSGTFSVINDTWGVPMVASYYGPLWVAIGRIVAGGATSVGSGIFALRLIELVPFATIVVMLAVRRAGIAVIALFALNPPLHMLFIVNGHNDLFGVALVLIALSLAASFAPVAAILVGLAGLVKVPFIASALLVFAGRGDLPRRVGWVALAVAICVGGSLLFAGLDYVHDLVFRFNQVNEHASRLNMITGKILRDGLLIVAAFALLAAFLRGVMWRAASWSLLAMSTVVVPWYLSWSFPYAALERGALARYLILFPVAAALLENAFPHLGTGQLAMALMLLAAAYAIVRTKSLRIGAAAAGDKQPARYQTVRPGP